MPSSKAPLDSPQWLKNLCCIAPLGALGLLASGAACGTAISWPVALVVGSLCNRVICASLGIPYRSLADLLPWRRKR